MKVTRKFENLEFTVDVTKDEITSYLSGLPLKERIELVKHLFEKDKGKITGDFKESVDTIKSILGGFL